MFAVGEKVKLNGYRVNGLFGFRFKSDVLDRWLKQDQTLIVRAVSDHNAEQSSVTVSEGSVLGIRAMVEPSELRYATPEEVSLYDVRFCHKWEDGDIVVVTSRISPWRHGNQNLAELSKNAVPMRVIGMKAPDKYMLTTDRREGQPSLYPTQYVHPSEVREATAGEQMRKYRGTVCKNGHKIKPGALVKHGRYGLLAIIEENGSTWRAHTVLDMGEDEDGYEDVKGKDIEVLGYISSSKPYFTPIETAGVSASAKPAPKPHQSMSSLFDVTMPVISDVFLRDMRAEVQRSVDKDKFRVGVPVIYKGHLTALSNRVCIVSTAPNNRGSCFIVPLGGICPEQVPVSKLKTLQEHFYPVMQGKEFWIGCGHSGFNAGIWSIYDQRPVRRNGVLRSPNGSVCTIKTDLLPANISSLDGFHAYHVPAI